MITEVAGDILLTKTHAIAHGVAPDDDFHTGLALALRERWPALYKDFRHYCKTRHPKAGDAWAWGGAGIRVVCLLTQEPPRSAGSRPGRASTTHVNHALRALRKIIADEGYTSVALPRLATGVGGLAWEDVRPLIETHLGDLEIPIVVYTRYEKGVAAAEPLR